MSQTVVDEDLLLGVGDDGTHRTLVGGPRHPELVGGPRHAELRQLGQELVVEVLGGVVLVQVRLPPECLRTHGARVQDLTACSGQVERGLRNGENIEMFQYLINLDTISIL